MIERYSIAATADKVRERFSADVPDFYKPHYNAAPTQLLPVITVENPAGISNFYWGASPEWSRNKVPSEKVINVRIENLMERPAFKRAVMKTRCLIPADGFYAWKKVGKKTMIPYRFVLQNRELFSMAGIWEEFEGDDGQMVHTFMIFTMAATQLVTSVCERMPVILDRQTEKLWLNKETREEELNRILTAPPATSLSLYTVSPRINEPSTDVPSLIIPVPPSDQHGNLTLFD